MPRAKAPEPQFDPVEHFLAYGKRLILDTGETWEIEDFQIAMFTPLLRGVKEVWSVIPEGNGKTTAMAAFGLYHCQFTRAPWVPIVASSRDQAEIMAQQAYEIIRATPGLEYSKRTHTGYFEILEGYRRIRCPRTGGRGIKVYAADVGTSDGGIPTLVLCDEGHRWPDLGPYRLWKGKLGKRKGQIGMTSTAGEPGGDFEEQRDKIRESATSRQVNGAFGHYEGHNIVLNEWAVPRREWVEDMARVKEANPFSAISEETLLDEFSSPTTDLGNWIRLKCNIAARASESAVTEMEWNQAETEARIPEGEHIMCGADVAWKHDTFSITPLWEFNPDSYEDIPEEEWDPAIRLAMEANEGKAFRLLGAPKILIPPRDGSAMHPDTVKLAFEQLMEHNIIDCVVIDLERAEDVAAFLQDEYSIEIIDRGQGNALAVEDYDAFMKALRNGARPAEGGRPAAAARAGALKHTGDRGLRKHVMNAIARSLPGQTRRFDRPSQSRAKKKQEKRVIDALTAAGMVNWYADQFVEEDPGEPLVAWR